MRFRRGRCETDGLPDARDGGAGVALFEKCARQIEVRLSKLGIDSTGLAEAFDGRIEFSLAREHHSGANLALRQIAIDSVLPELLHLGELLARGGRVASLPRQGRQ